MAGHPELDVALEYLNRAEIRVVEQGRRLQFYIFSVCTWLKFCSESNFFEFTKSYV